ncbi:MAG: hypothetical protein RBS48_07875, partial [Ignavibacteriaceae bacterium]|nr:hypothetical protein [Ignavibacteriaceae bacterium]
MKRVSYLLLAVAYLSLLSVKTYSQIKVDGLFFDWLPKYQLDVSPNEEKTFADGDETVPARGGTNAAYFADLDIDDLYATDDANFVYLRIKMNSIGNILNVPNDTSYHGGAALAVYISVDPGEGDTTGLTWGWWGNGYDYLIQAFPSDSLAENTTMYPQYIYEHKQTGNGWDYEIASPTLGAQVVWNSTNNDVEIAIPKSILLHPRNIANFAGTDKIAIMVYAGENNAPWRADYCSTPGIGGFLLNLKPEGKVAIDGNFFDWQQDTQLDLGDNAEKTFADGDETEPARGSSEPSYYADLDIDDVFATDDEDNVYVRIKMNSIADVSRIA